MNRKGRLLLWIILMGMLVGVGGVSAQDGVTPSSTQAALGTDFTYQGYLTSLGTPANGTFDFQFKLYDAPTGGATIGSTVTVGDVSVVNGLFIIELDFGSAVFGGDARYLEIGVRPGSETGVYDVFGARQPLTAVPYAQYSQRVSWSGIAGVPSDLADGDANTTYTAGDGLTVSGTEFSVDQSVVQFRVSGTCPKGSAIRSVNQDGTVVCESTGAGTHDHWGATWNGSGIGLTLQSSDGTGIHATADSGTGYGGYFANQDNNGPGLYARSGGDSASDPDSDLVLGGSVGILRSDPDVTASDLQFMANDDMVMVAENHIELNTTSSSGDVKLNSADEIYLDAVDDVNLDSGDDIYLDSGDDIYVEAEDDMFIQSAEDFSLVMGSVNSKDDHFILYRHLVDSGKKMLEVDEGANLTVYGDLNVVGSKSAMVDTVSYGTRKMYAIESPGNWFEDFGGAQLHEGTAIVTIEPMYAETVNLQEDYRVFLTPLGDCPLYVVEKTPTTFTVNAMDGRTCDIAFDYRIVAKRLGYEDVRMEVADPIQDPGLDDGR